MLSDDIKGFIQKNEVRVVYLSSAVPRIGRGMHNTAYDFGPISMLEDLLNDMLMIQDYEELNA
jgi:hypothetical protein